MMMKRSLLAVSVAALIMVGCKKKDETADGASPAQEAATQQQPANEATVATGPAAPAPTAGAATFDLNSFPMSDMPMGAWPYLQLPAGYIFFQANGMAAATKDLARVPVWTGADMIWVEGKSFESQIDTQDGKTYSKFELEKSIADAVEALGGKRVTDKSVDEAFFNAHEAELESFLKEFSEIAPAYRHYNKANTWLVRRADKAIWFVSFADESENAALMVVEGPLPVAAAK